MEKSMQKKLAGTFSAHHQLPTRGAFGQKNTSQSLLKKKISQSPLWRDGFW
jgi:hypothetical protein